jgi:glyoxylase-like metal-dependent hydrolase (beta-lactamase superfamily II)
MVGDAVGVRLPDLGVLRPATPPPDFDLDQAVSSLRRFRELRPVRVVLTHYGEVPDANITLLEAEDVLHQWVEVAQRTMMSSETSDVDTVAAALADAFAEAPGRLSPDQLEKFEVLNGVHSNAAGIVRYLRRRNESAVAPLTPPHPAA